MKPQHPHIVCQISHVTKCSVTTCYDRATLPTLIEGTTFFSITEVATSCGVSRQTFWRWRQDGSVPQGRQDRHARLMFTEAELDLTRAFAGGVTSPRAAASTSIYLDNAASTRPLAAVRDAMVRAMELEFGNPSSAHSDGRRARQAVEDARDAVASLVGADPSSVIFTSGGTEANNWVLQGAPQIGVHRFIVSAAEHSSILGVLPHLEAKGFETIILPVDHEGIVSQKSLESCVIDGKTLVSIQWANNETGVIQRVGEISNYVKSRGGFFHTDAVQIVGKQQIDFNQSSIDAMTITAHKIHGPQGVGALIRKQSFKPAPLLWGGSQENGHRVGTENYLGIVGFGVAAAHRQATMRNFIRHTRGLRDFIESQLRSEISSVRINGSEVNRVCSIGNVLVPKMDGQAFVAQLDALGIRVSQSSACANMQPLPSHVLRAIGMSEDDAYSSFRFAVSEDTSFEVVTRAAQVMIDIAIKLGAKPVRDDFKSIQKEVA